MGVWMKPTDGHPVAFIDDSCTVLAKKLWKIISYVLA
jgi:hypothetical protein